MMLQRPTDDTRTGINPQIHPFCFYSMGQSQSQSVFYHQELQWPHGIKGFPVGSDGKEFSSNVGDLGSILRSGRSPGERHCNPLQYSCLENPWTEEPGGLQSMGSQRVGQYRACTLCPSIASGLWGSENDRWLFTPSPWGWSFWGPSVLSGLGFDTSLLPEGFAVSSCWEALFVFFMLF